MNMADETLECAELLALATPHLYRRNLFRILGLPITATSPDVHRQQNRREMQRRLGIAPDQGQEGPFNLTPPPSAQDVRQAMERLDDPESRLLDEIFWFWPTDGDAASDAALRALQSGDIKRASAIWDRLTCRDGQGPIAVHNLAVLHHLVALDYELRIITSGLNDKNRQRLAKLWPKVFMRWREVLDGEGFWSQAKERVRMHNDQQLTTGLIRRIRATLPKALLLINAKIAFEAAERADAEMANRHLQIIREANYESGLVEAAIRESLAAPRRRLKTVTENARSQWTRLPHRANEYVRDLHRQAQQLLEVVDVVLDEADPIRIGLHDMVADAMLEGQVTFVRKTDQWGESIELLQLARQLAAGQPMQEKLGEQIGILENQRDMGNDWCASGYWELPEQVIERLEAIRAMTEAGDFDGAIQALLVLDPAIGKPLRRCLGYCLSIKGVRVGNAALEEYNQETAVIRKILAKLRNASQDRMLMLLNNRPNPYSQVVPPCLCCGSKYYTSWVNFTYKEIPLFMCSACSQKHDREVEQQKDVLRRSLRESLEYLLLAEEVDPGDRGVRKNLDAVKKTARDINCSIPGTSDLKRRLCTSTTRSTQLILPADSTSGTCFFCGETAADDSCRITVPMCGGIQSVEFLFHRGTEYQYTDVPVPRCRRCRDEHRELPGRRAQWHQARAEASDEQRFPELLPRLRQTEQAHKQAEARAATHQQTVAEAQAHLRRAEAIGQVCDHCHSKRYWDGYLCRRCDQELFQLGGMAKSAVAALVTLGLFLAYVLFGDVNIVLTLIAGAVPLIASVALVGVLKNAQIERQDELRTYRAQEIPQRREAALAEARARLNEAQRDLASAQKNRQAASRAYQQARAKLRAAQEQAVAEFEQIYPQPKLSPGIKDEEACIEYPTIQELLGKGWGFGHEPLTDNGKLRTSPTGIRGLVGEHQQAKDDGQPPSSSLREQIRRLAREAGDDAMIPCPVCRTQVKSRNLIRHYDKAHSGVEESQRSLDAAASGRDTAGRTDCPHGHGPLQETHGKKCCWTCGWPEKNNATSAATPASSAPPVVRGYQCPQCGSFSNVCRHRVSAGLLVQCKRCGQEFVNGAA